MSDLIERLEAMQAGGSTPTGWVNPQALAGETLIALHAKDALIEEMVEAFQSLGSGLMSEASVSSRAGQMERLEALADDAFMRARSKAKGSLE